MGRGPKKHLKRISAPHHWMLDKLGGVFAPKPSPGPHKNRECIPLAILVRNRLKYALNSREIKMVLMQRHVKVDGKVRTNPKYPAGFQDIITIEKTNEFFRLLYDVKGRFILQRITPQESKYKLCKIKRQEIGQKGIPYIVTHDGRTIRYAHPNIKVNDTIKLNLETGKIEEFVKFDLGNIVMITGGRNTGRVGVIMHKEKHPGSFEIVYVKDAAGQHFATRVGNVFVIGKGVKSLVSLPRNKGIKRTPLEEAELAAKRASNAQPAPTTETKA